MKYICILIIRLIIDVTGLYNRQGDTCAVDEIMH